MGTLVENGTTCCYAQQDKVWVHGPGQEPWEVYTVTGDSATLGTDSAALAAPATCCQSDATAGEADRVHQSEGCCA